MKNKIFICMLLSLLLACEKDNNEWVNNREELLKHNKNKVSITEGVWGTLLQREGNCMPIVGEGSSCKEYPIKREIVVYEYTTIEETKHTFSTFFEVYTKLVATTVCDEDGFFELKLNPGNYSVFVKEKQHLYANGFDGQGGIAAIAVDSSKVSETCLVLDYAVY